MSTNETPTTGDTAAREMADACEQALRAYVASHRGVHVLIAGATVSREGNVLRVKTVEGIEYLMTMTRYRS